MNEKNWKQHSEVINLLLHVGGGYSSKKIGTSTYYTARSISTHVIYTGKVDEFNDEITLKEFENKQEISYKFNDKTKTRAEYIAQFKTIMLDLGEDSFNNEKKQKKKVNKNG